MAYIPDAAIYRMCELSAGAWRLYCFLALCRNQKTGKCFPSVTTVMEHIGVNRSTVYTLRRELQAKKWATINGNNVTALLGFNSPINQTSNDVPKEDKTNTTSAVFEKSDSLKNQTPKSEKSNTVFEKSNSHIRKNQQIEPANRTSKGKARPKAAVPPAVAFVRQLTHRYPDKTLWPRIVQTLGEDFDQERLSKCYENWVSHGWNKMNLVWLFEWYVTGVPERNIGNGKTRVSHKETPNERNAREYEELVRASIAATNSNLGADTEDAGS